ITRPLVEGDRREDRGGRGQTHDPRTAIPSDGPDRGDDHLALTTLPVDRPGHFGQPSSRGHVSGKAYGSWLCQAGKPDLRTERLSFSSGFSSCRRPEPDWTGSGRP